MSTTVIPVQGQSLEFSITEISEFSSSFRMRYIFNSQVFGQRHLRPFSAQKGTMGDNTHEIFVPWKAALRGVPFPILHTHASQTSGMQVNEEDILTNVILNRRQLWVMGYLLQVIVPRSSTFHKNVSFW